MTSPRLWGTWAHDSPRPGCATSNGLCSRSWCCRGAVLFLWSQYRRRDEVRDADVTRGAITVTVTATGNLEPRNQVDIGSELSGTMRLVNVDVNDVVKKGQVLAVLDTTRLKAQVLQAESSLASAQARVLQSEASAKEAQANYQRLLKVRELSGNRLPSQQDLDVAESTVARANGETAAAEAVGRAVAREPRGREDGSRARPRSSRPSTASCWSVR